MKRGSYAVPITPQKDNNQARGLARFLRRGRGDGMVAVDEKRDKRENSTCFPHLIRLGCAQNV